MPNLPDEQLISDYLKGDQESLNILISRYLKSIFNFTYRYTNNPKDAEDITQEVFIKVWKNIKKFNQQKKFKPWIYKIAYNSSLDFLREKKIIPFSDFENEAGKNIFTETLVDPEPLPKEIFDRKNLAKELTAALDKLSLKNRSVVLLHLNDHLTFQEISETLEESLDTVKSRYRRALIELRGLLNINMEIRNN